MGSGAINVPQEMLCQCSYDGWTCLRAWRNGWRTQKSCEKMTSNQTDHEDTQTYENDAYVGSNSDVYEDVNAVNFEISESVSYDAPASPTSKQEQLSEEIATKNESSQFDKCIGAILIPQQKIGSFLKTYSYQITLVIKILFVMGYIAYMVAAMLRDFERAVPMLVIFCVVFAYKVYAFLRNNWGNEIWKCWKPVYEKINDNIYWIKWIFILILLALLGTWIALDTAKRPMQLISMAGYIVFLFFLFLGSNNPQKIWWRPVLWGLGIEICLGMFILRTQPGYEAFNWLGNFAQTFLDFVDAGAIFLFGELFYEHYFAFKVLPIIIYFGSFVSMLYYLGAMQWMISKIGWIMQFTLGTSATESMCAAGNIFVGQTESPLLIRPYLKDLTTSEMHAIMTAGFGTVAGSTLGAYFAFGIQPVYVVSASVMAAPCALAISKLIYPETEKSKFLSSDAIEFESTGQRNLIDAASDGASSAVPLVLNIAANLLAFISLLAAINAGLSWFGGLLDYPELSFELICSYVFSPITLLMGIELDDAFKCAELLGVKIFLNEFIAYEQLQVLIGNRDNGTIPREDPDGNINWISYRSEAIITYALCGFANIGSIGIVLGGLGSMCPERRQEMATIVMRALIAGIFVSIENACIAGFLYVPPNANCTQLFSYESWDTVELSGVYSCCQEEIAKNNTVLSVDGERCCDYTNWSNNLSQDDLGCE